MGFTLTIPDNAAGVHVGTFGGTYSCTSGTGTEPPQWNGSAKVDACGEKISETNIPFTIDLDGDEFKWIKAAMQLVEKIPLVKKADASLKPSAPRRPSAPNAAAGLHRSH